MSNLLNLATMAALAKRLNEMQARMNTIKAERGPQGESGPQGPQGEPGDDGAPGSMGPMPRHQWKGTQLRFEMSPGEWGKYTDLKGDPGGKRVVVFEGAAVASGVPIVIAEGERFVVPANQQMIYSYPITVDGVLEIDGVLIEA